MRVPSRALLATVLLAALPLSAGPASATPYCNLLVDPVGDARPASLTVLDSTRLDIVSGDVATGATTVVAVLRVRSLDPDTATALGGSWAFSWQVAGKTYAVTAIGDNNGSYHSGKTKGIPITSVSLAVDVPNGTFTWTVPRSAVTELATPGQVLDHLAATSSMSLGPAGSTSADAATSTATYPDLAPSCVAAA